MRKEWSNAHTEGGDVLVLESQNHPPPVPGTVNDPMQMGDSGVWAILH